MTATASHLGWGGGTRDQADGMADPGTRSRASASFPSLWPHCPQHCGASTCLPGCTVGRHMVDGRELQGQEQGFWPGGLLEHLPLAFTFWGIRFSTWKQRDKSE